MIDIQDGEIMSGLVGKDRSIIHRYVHRRGGRSIHEDARRGDKWERQEHADKEETNTPKPKERFTLGSAITITISVSKPRITVPEWKITVTSA
jgi:hypothetical protein